jgi:aminoglycoside phosphotransferase (APT) family kinase protein
MQRADILDEKRVTGFIRQVANADAVELIERTWRSTGTRRDYVELKLRITGGGYAGDNHLLLCIGGDGPTGHQGQLPISTEFGVVNAAFKKGVAVPEPLWLCDGAGEVPFYVARAIKLRAAEPSGATAWLAVYSLSADACWSFGADLSRLHRIQPSCTNLAHLPSTCSSSAMRHIEDCRRAMDADEDPLPAIEWSLRWLEKHLPKAETVALCHGNYCIESSIEGEGRPYILEWGQAGWGNPYQDLASFLTSIDYRTLKGHKENWPKVFCDSYQEESGEQLDFAQIAFWEVMGKVNRCVAMCRKVDQLRSGGTLGIKQMLESRVRSKLELDILTHIDFITTHATK